MYISVYRLVDITNKRFIYLTLHSNGWQNNVFLVLNSICVHTHTYIYILYTITVLIIEKFNKCIIIIVNKQINYCILIDVNK